MAKFSKPDGALFTQISSGIYRGKKLALPALSSTRSTKSIVKGSFFDTWRAELRGAAFIECFGGSGAMALEALSNGAKNVYAIEKDAAAHKIMRKNFELFGLGANAILGDCFERLPEILHDLQANMNECSAVNLSESQTVNSNENSVTDPARRVFVYLDPPFAIRQGFGEIYERVLALIARLGSAQCELLIAIEHMSELELPPKIGDFALLKSRKFGATTMSYYVK
ncbi:RsmD family RNA methyltransferase [uncultured Campylobacter sp.]|uniref:RsmD family RNA methyltransferase n=1 Tax=uncultured Campylobacter sp. TaxID=218934 RepID=UPI0026022009|nr:RsmD family RNA methyltransferase [uncultured Campylobacter sp.]